MSFWGRRGRRKDVPNFNVASEVERLARNESRSAFAFVDEAGIIERHGYGDVSRRATRWASLLTESGVRPGDRVLVLAGRTIEWPSALLGVMKAGAVAVPCPAALDADELDARAADCEAVLVVSAGATASVLTLPTLDADDERARLDAQPLATPTYPADGRDPALILYSRGRGVVHTHASCRAQALPAEQWLDLREGDRVWCTAEPGTTDSILSLLGAWMLGAEWLLHEDTPDADGRLELIDQAGVTVLWQTAAEYEGMSAVERPHWYDLSRVRTAVTTGEPLSVEEGDRFLVTFAIPVLAGWGQAETGIVIGERRGSASRPGTIGLALGEVDVAVVDERGQELPIGVEGELAVRGRPPGLFDGYWNAQRETAAALRKDVYLTGIGASRDDAGHVRLVERQPPAVVSLPERRRRDAVRVAEEQRVREADERRRVEEETRLAEVSAAEERLARRQEQKRHATERAEQQRLKADERARRSQEQQQQREARHAEKAERERLKVERRVEQERIRREQDEARRAAKLAGREAASAQKQEQAEQRSRDEAEARAAKERAAAEQRRREEEEARLAQEQAAAHAREQEQARQAALERERAAAEAEARERAERAAAEAEARERAERAPAERRRLDEERERAAAAAVAAEARRREARAQAEAAEERERQAAAERKRAEEERRRHEERERAAAEAKLREQARAEAEARERAERAAAERRRLDEERRRREAEPATKGRRRTETRLRRSKPPATPPTPELAESEEPDAVHHGLLDRMRAYGISVTPPEDASPSPDEPDEKRERAS